MTVVDANGHESAPDDHSGVDVYVMQGDGSTGWALRVNSPTANPNGGTTPVGWYLYVNQGSDPLIRQQPAGQPTPMGEPYWLLAPAPLRATYNARNQTASMTDACGNVVPFTYNGPGEGERLSAGWATSGACVPGEYGATTYTWNGLGLGSKTDSTGTTYYTLDASGWLISERTPNGTNYYHYDDNGNVVMLTDASGNPVTIYNDSPTGGQLS